MNTRTVLGLTLAVATLTVACSDDVTHPEPDPSMDAIEGELGLAGPPGARSLIVLSRNLYLGGEIQPILAFQPDPGKSPQENQVAFIQVVAGVWDQIQATDFPARANVLAREVRITHPDVIGVQEAARFVRLVVDASGTPVAPPELVYDYLTIFLDALARKGLNYHVATVAQNVQAALPVDLTGTVIQYTDHDVILVRDGVDILSAESGNYAAFVPAPVLGGAQTLNLLRGWNRADVQKRGRRYHIVNTHFETDETSAAVQEAQAGELIAALQTEDDPIVLMGDLNALEDGSTSTTYPDLTAAGFRDAWILGTPLGIRNGDTCCHEPDLRNDRAAFFERIDYMMLGNGFENAKVLIGVVGGRPFSKTRSGLWASDHAGLAARIIMR